MTRSASASARVEDAACGAALRALAKDCQADLKRHVRSAARGDADALHHVRIALTRLRAAIRFFGPAINRRDWERLQQQAQWLSRHAGKARDLDVALAHQKRATDRTVERWHAQRERRYDELRAALRTARYRHFVQQLAHQSARSRPTPPISAAIQRLKSFSTSRLERWRRQLVKHCNKSMRMGPHKRHRLRKRAKRFKYALDWSQAVLKDKRTMLRQQIEQAQIVQNALGKVNDGATHRAQARKLRLDPLPRMARLDQPGSRRKLLMKTKGALERLELLKLG